MIESVYVRNEGFVSGPACANNRDHNHAEENQNNKRVRANPMLGGWVNPHREQQTIPQGQTSSPPKSFFTPTAKAHPDQPALPTSAEARRATHEHGFGGIDEKRPTEKFVILHFTSRCRDTQSNLELKLGQKVDDIHTYICIYIYVCIHIYVYAYMYA